MRSAEARRTHTHLAYSTLQASSWGREAACLTATCGCSHALCDTKCHEARPLIKSCWHLPRSGETPKDATPHHAHSLPCRHVRLQSRLIQLLQGRLRLPRLPAATCYVESKSAGSTTHRLALRRSMLTPPDIHQHSQYSVLVAMTCTMLPQNDHMLQCRPAGATLAEEAHGFTGCWLHCLGRPAAALTCVMQPKPGGTADAGHRRPTRELCACDGSSCSTGSPPSPPPGQAWGACQYAHNKQGGLQHWQIPAGAGLSLAAALLA